MPRLGLLPMSCLPVHGALVSIAFSVLALNISCYEMRRCHVVICQTAQYASLVKFPLGSQVSCGCWQVTDDWVEATWPGQGSLANLKNNLLQAVQQRARHETQDKVRMAITHALSELVDVDIPDSMIEDVAKNEFQAKLFEVGQKVRMGTGTCWQPWLGSATSGMLQAPTGAQEAPFSQLIDVVGTFV